MMWHKNKTKASQSPLPCMGVFGGGACSFPWCWRLWRVRGGCLWFGKEMGRGSESVWDCKRSGIGSKGRLFGQFALV